jgi:hypothetical protein
MTTSAGFIVREYAAIYGKVTYDSEILRHFGGWFSGTEIFIAIVGATVDRSWELWGKHARIYRIVGLTVY